MWAVRGRPAPTSLAPAVRSGKDVLRDPVVALPAAAVGVGLVYSAVLAIATPPNDFDTLWYHLSKAAFWRQEHAVGYVERANDLRLDVFTPGAELVSAWAMTLSGNERFAALFQLFALAATMLAVAGIARRLGLDRRAAALGALLFASLPVVLLQASTALNDLALASLPRHRRLLRASGRADAPRARWAGAGARRGDEGHGADRPARAGATRLRPHTEAALARRRCRRGGRDRARSLLVLREPRGDRELRATLRADGRGGDHLARLGAREVPRAARQARDRCRGSSRLGGTRPVRLRRRGRRRARGRSRDRRAAAAAAASPSRPSRRRVVVALPATFVTLHEKLLTGYQRVWVDAGKPDLAFLGAEREAVPPSPFVSWYGALGVLLVIAVGGGRSSGSATWRTAQGRSDLRAGAGALPRGDHRRARLHGLPRPLPHARCCPRSCHLGPRVARAGAGLGRRRHLRRHDRPRVRPLPREAGRLRRPRRRQPALRLERVAGRGARTFARAGRLRRHGGYSSRRLPRATRSRSASARTTSAIHSSARTSTGASSSSRTRVASTRKPTGSSSPRASMLEICAAGWRPRPTGEPGWRLYRRVGLCPGETASSAS